MSLLSDLIFSPPLPGCILTYPGLPGGGSTIFDRSIYGNQGLISGASWVRSPGGLWCLDFDGIDDGVDCGGPAFAITEHITLMTWVKITGNPNADYAGIMCERGNGNYRIIGQLSANPTVLTFGIRDAAGAMRWTSSPYDIGAGWHFVAGTYDGQAINFYVDGELRRQAAFVGSIQVSANPGLYLGNDTWGRRPKAMIALPAVHRRALSAFEIQQEFSRQKDYFA